jgi:osomolarity two-component system response regulator SSK1
MRPKQKDSDSAPTSSPALFPGILDTSVPPINVLIVEDNMINMRLLEQFVRRLGVRWQTAVNGREAVTKWRRGGFHLVLMDIQLPIMSGLEATREIRRLERINGIGVFSSASSESPELAGFGGDGVKDGGGADKKVKEEVKEEDKLFEEGYSRLFKSPVIIVALTASNLQSDRHEALAAGCNDFLTKVRPSLPSPHPFLPSPNLPSSSPSPSSPV